MYKIRLICRYCGKEMLVAPERRNQRYCSRSCASRCKTLPKEYAPDQPLEWVKTSEDPSDCIFAEGLCCEKRQCGNCGWNPEVAQKRLEKFLGKWGGADAT